MCFAVILLVKLLFTVLQEENLRSVTVLTFYLRVALLSSCSCFPFCMFSLCLFVSVEFSTGMSPWTSHFDSSLLTNVVMPLFSMSVTLLIRKNYLHPSAILSDHPLR